MCGRPTAFACCFSPDGTRIASASYDGTVAELPCSQRRSFVDPSQKHVAEEDRPDGIIDFVEADAMLTKRGRDVRQASLETDGPGVGDALEREVVRDLSAGSTPV